MRRNLAILAFVSLSLLLPAGQRADFDRIERSGPPLSILTQSASISLPTSGSIVSAPLSVPVTTSDLTGLGVIAFDFDLVFDPSVLQPQSMPVDQSGTLSASMTLTPNATTGRLRVSGFGTSPLSGSGTLLKLNFNAVGAAGSFSNLTWQKFQFNEGSPAVTATGGRINLAAAANLSIAPSMQTIKLTRDASFTVTIDPVQTVATTVGLSSSNSSLVTVPASIVIPAGQAAGSFKATGAAPGGPVTITAALPAGLGGKTATATANVIRIVACFSAADYSSEPLATESIVAMFGIDMATTSLNAPGVPLPTTLGGTRVEVRDANGTSRLAPLFYISPTQVNYQIPEGTAAGNANITVTSGNGTVSIGSMAISNVAPGIFTADSTGTGVAAALAYRYKNDGSVTGIFTFEWNSAMQKYVSVPIDLGVDTDINYLVLFATGVRYRSSLANTLVRIGGTDAPVEYAGPQGDYVGLDQLNIRLPRTLIARGEVDVVLTVDGLQTKTVRVNIK